MKINKDKHSEICKLYISGLSSLKIAKLFNCTCVAIRKILKANNITMRKPIRTGEISTTEQRFYKKFVKTEGCWEWKNCKPKRYGSFYYKKQIIPAHRVSYMMFKGDIPDGLFVCHTCDNRRCVNPEHLFLGTADDNNKDRHHKGRSKGGKLKGETNPRSKLTEVEVLQIKELIKAGQKLKDIAIIFGVHAGTISGIKNNKRWKYLGE